MSKEKQKREYESKQLIEELSKMSPVVIATAYLHAINYTLYGEDVTEKWLTATQNASALEKAYRKGFIDGVNDTSERFKSSAYKQKHDAELLNKVGEYLFNSTYASEKIADFDFDQTVTFTKAEWFKILEEMKAGVTKNDSSTVNP